jgi:hypothetical protein
LPSRPISSVAYGNSIAGHGLGLCRSVNKNSRFLISNDQGTTIFATVFAIVFLQNHSGDSEHALLVRPVQRQPHSFDESLRGELGGLPARGNDLDDCGR